jgi:hypothetical protein
MNQQNAARESSKGSFAEVSRLQAASTLDLAPCLDLPDPLGGHAVLRRGPNVAGSSLTQPACSSTIRRLRSSSCQRTRGRPSAVARRSRALEDLRRLVFMVRQDTRSARARCPPSSGCGSRAMSRPVSRSPSPRLSLHAQIPRDHLGFSRRHVAAVFFMLRRLKKSLRWCFRGRDLDEPPVAQDVS